MNDIQKIAMSRVKFDRSSVPVGEHSVDFTVRVRGTVKVGADYSKAARMVSCQRAMLSSHGMPVVAAFE